MSPGPNPYNFNLPVGPEMFYGREQDVRALVTQLTAMPGDSFALIGGRRMGKTSLLEQVLAALEQPAGDGSSRLIPIPLLIDLSGQGIRSASGFFVMAAEETYERLADGLGVDPGRPEPPGPEQPPGPWLKRLLQRWNQAATRERGLPLRLILLLDECEQIVEQDWAPDLYGALRYLLDGQPTRLLLKVVMAGSQRFLTQVQQHGSPLRNLLAYHRLRVLDGGATRRLITEPGRLDLPDEVVDAVAAQTGGHPFLTQYVMHRLWDRVGGLSAEAVHNVSREFAHERTDFDDWSEGLGRSGRAVARLLLHAGGEMTEDEIRAALNPAPADLLQTLEALCYHGLVVRDDGGECYRRAGRMYYDWFEETMGTQGGPAGVKEIDPDHPPLGTLRELMTAAFTPEELARFCRDRPELQPAAGEFGSRQGLNAMVDAVLEYCQTRLLWNYLLAEIAACYPRQYERFEARL